MKAELLVLLSGVLAVFGCSLESEVLCFVVFGGAFAVGLLGPVVWFHQQNEMTKILRGE